MLACSGGTPYYCINGPMMMNPGGLAGGPGGKGGGGGKGGAGAGGPSYGIVTIGAATVATASATTIRHGTGGTGSVPGPDGNRLTL